MKTFINHSDVHVCFCLLGASVSVLLGQWLNFKLFGITYSVEKIKFKLFFFRVHWLSEQYHSENIFFPVQGFF